MSKPKKLRGSAVGLALVAMLAFGAFAASAAQASPVWHYNGKTLKEAGLTKVGYTIDGSHGAVVSFAIPSWNVTVNCTANRSWGYVEGESSGTGTFKVEECKVQNNKNCNVPSMVFQVQLGLEAGGKTGVIETFTPPYSFATLEFTGSKCSLNELELGLFNSKSQSLGAEVGAEGKAVPLSGLPAYLVEAGGVNVSLSGPLTLMAEDRETMIGAW